MMGTFWRAERAAGRHRRCGGAMIASVAVVVAHILYPVRVASAYHNESASPDPQEHDAESSRISPAQCQPLARLKRKFDNSWINHLSPETQANRARSHRTVNVEDDGVSNTISRPVYNGHYVPVKPTALKNPRLVIHAADVANMLDLSDNDVSSTAFLKLFSGDVESAFDGISMPGGGDDDRTHPTWATPYALSIMGDRYTSNCPFKTGDGYGDGRAISLGEVRVSEDNAQHPAGARYELQLKGSGPTPFCRGADGRAVLRSSIREFLASEAMAALGISTTRALSLIVSDGPDGDTVDRPWYSDRNTRKDAPSINDPLLSRYSLQQRRQIIRDWTLWSKSDPDVLIKEPCAITTRVSPSYIRVGHFDLYARRIIGQEQGNRTDEWKELEQMLWHTCFREYPKECFEPYWKVRDAYSAVKCLLKNSMDDLSTMTANWIRVGFAQGNFNADNCLIAGRTMDYGPFGFMDEYHPLFAKWTGSGDHYGFMNQPTAGYANFKVLVESLMPLIERNEAGIETAKNDKSSILSEAQALFDTKVKEIFRVKLGFHPMDSNADTLWVTLEPLLRASHADWTVFWRQLYMIAAKEFTVQTETTASEGRNAESMLEYLVNAFYKPIGDQVKDDFISWIGSWRSALAASFSVRTQNMPYIEPAVRMRTANPKYILREWMLVDAYTRSSPPVLKSMPFSDAVDPSKGDDYTIHELLDLVQSPYGEGSVAQEKKYYRRAPDEALIAGGTAFMS
uniref:Selenoprotein O n=1 Tax=Odontella aurita TaxID=265563 RepID=A0A7S4KDP2_9STRA|mmetsp:Transcript_9570/g.28716  ORF Transcript_9570/g.28716 Transcript_9570/m.28716 type:complete len:739 (+) Transcript_9570:137-2353(+)